MEKLVKSAIRMVICFYFSLILGTPTFAACGLTKVTEMPLVKLGAHYAVMVQIDDVVRPMIVDTGAEVTSISLSAADELELKRDSSLANARPTVGIGQTKAEVYPNAIPSVLALGKLVFRHRSTTVAKIEFGDVPEHDSIGLLGDDILSHFDVEFDFPGRKLTFYRAIDCYDTFIPWTGTYSTIPFVHDNAKILIDAILNEERNQAIVDTGNSVSFVSRNLLARWRVPDSELAKTNGKMRSPLNEGTSFAIKSYAFDVVKIGYEVFPSVRFSIIDVDYPLMPINLGLDFWASRKVWISYPSKWMFLSQKDATKLAYPVRTIDRDDVEADARDAPVKRRLEQ
jgi:gag-polyprotein putative aspartyl protease